MNFLKKIFKRPVTVCTVAILVFGFGMLAAFNMPVNLLPDIAFPALGVTVAYPGASAETCDETVRPLLESSIKTLSNVKSVTSYSIENATMVAITFDYGTDVDKKTDEIKDKLALVSFPDSCYDPIFTKIDFNGNAVATVTVYNDGDEEECYSDAKALREKILAVENVGSVELVGVPEDKIVLRPFNGLEVTAPLLVQQLATNSQLDIPLGTITESGGKVSFRNESFAKTIEEIQNTYFQMPLSRELGTSLRIAKTAMDYLQSTPSATLIEYRDNIKKFSDDLAAIEVKTGEEILKEFEEQVDVNSVIASLRSWGFTEVADSLESLYTFVKNNPQAINIPGELIIKLQTEAAKVLNDDFFELFDTVIEFKKEYEYVNEITGELVQEEIKPKDFVELLKKLDLGLPINLSEDFVRFIEEHDFSELSYDSDGNANLNVKISDVATVKEERSFPSFAYYNGRQAVTLKVYGISGGNTAKISSEVKKLVEQQTGSSVAVLIDDQSQFITDSVSNVISSMIIGGVLAVLVILLFLKKFNTSLIIAVTMPLSVLGAMGCMYLMGITLNMVSLGGLAVGIGMLVDNSIVIIESVNFERDKGKTAFQAAVDGTKLVAGSLLASTLTSVCVFFPILFTKGLTEMIFADLSWSVIFSLAFSLVVALTVIPTLYCLVCGDKRMLTGKVLKKKSVKTDDSASELSAGTAAQTSAETAGDAPAERAENGSHKKDKNRVKRKGNRTSIMKGAMKFYDGFLRKCLRTRALVLIITFIIFAGSATMVFTTGTAFMPSVDQKTIEVSIVFDASDELDYCKEKTYQVYENVKNGIDDIKHLSADISDSSLIATSVHGTIRLVLNDDAKKKTKTVLEEVRNIAENSGVASVSVTEVDGVLAALMSGFGGISTIGVSVEGEDIAVLREISQKVKDKATSEYSYFTNVSDNLSGENVEYKIKFDYLKCFENGIDYKVAVATLRAGIAGYTACTVSIGGERYDVSVKFKDDAIEDYYGGIEDYVLSFSGDKSVKLKDVATITKTMSPTMITRENGKNVMTLSVETSTDIDAGTAGETFTKIIEEVLQDYSGYEFKESGVNRYLNEVFEGLIITMIIAFILLFAVMACQFESLVKPFIVIFSIPLSFSGAFLALTISGLPLNIVSFIGIIMLMGVVVNNAIVMIDRIEQLKTDYGYSDYTALIEGSKSRMRAIWMSTLTTVLALVPLALAIGRGSELMQPLGVVVMGGLTLATLVTLIIIPVMYSIVKRVRIPKKGSEESFINPELLHEGAVAGEVSQAPVSVEEETETCEIGGASETEEIKTDKEDNACKENKAAADNSCVKETVEVDAGTITLICDDTRKVEILSPENSKIVIKCKDAKTVYYRCKQTENVETETEQEEPERIVENFNNGRGVSERYVKKAKKTIKKG